jgi:replicative DNA helicase
MWMDVDLLSLVTTREAFERIKPHLKEETLSKEALTIYNVVDNWYDSFPLFNSFTWAELETHFFVTKGATLPKASIGLYKTIFSNLAAYTTSSTRDELLKHYIDQEYAAKLEELINAVRAGRLNIDDAEAIVDAYKAELGKASGSVPVFVGDDVSDIITASSGPGLDWRLNELNISLGPLRIGDFVLVAARPEVGKTTFLADNVSYMATQIKDKRPVLWVNNEERSGKVQFRVIQAALGDTSTNIEADPKAALLAYQKLMGMEERVLITRNDSGYNSVKTITALCKKHNPALIVFDQLDKVVGLSRGQDERDDLRLGRIYNWARDLSHSYGPVIAASQADASAEGMMWLDQSKLRGSKTDKPGEADAIITIGVDEDRSLKRYINIPKNKLHGGPKSLEKERHGKWEVEMKPEIARYVGTK